MELLVIENKVDYKVKLLKNNVHVVVIIYKSLLMYALV